MDTLSVRLTKRWTSAGTGNGHLLFALAEMDPPLTEPKLMLGIDYSPSSIQLSQNIAKKRGPPCSEIGFDVYDFLDAANIQRLKAIHEQGWDLICDKGTLDAIALSREGNSSSDSQEDPVKRYASAVAQICKPGTLFVITSCNFTEEELRLIFDQGFRVHHVVPTPSFSFVSLSSNSQERPSPLMRCSLTQMSLSQRVDKRALPRRRLPFKESRK